MIVFMYIRQREPAKIVSKEWKLTIVFLRGLNVVSPDGNGRTGRMILFRESLKNESIRPFIILDENRSDYIEGLKEYRESKSVRQLIRFMEKEADSYYQNCQYFIS